MKTFGFVTAVRALQILPTVMVRRASPKPLKGVPAGPGWGCDSNKVTQWASGSGAVKFIPSCIPDFSLGLPNGGAFEPTPASYAPTVMDRLDSETTAAASTTRYGPGSTRTVPRRGRAAR